MAGTTGLEPAHDSRPPHIARNSLILGPGASRSKRQKRRFRRIEVHQKYTDSALRFGTQRQHARQKLAAVPGKL